jgi:hypothetical protein
MTPATRTHLIIPDTQAKLGVPTDHLRWIGEYIVERKPDVVIHLGDHADMPSLSSYDVGKRDFEGRRYADDIEASADKAFDVLCAPPTLATLATGPSRNANTGQSATSPSATTGARIDPSSSRQRRRRSPPA